MKLDTVIKKTEEYIYSDVSEHYRSIAELILKELKKIQHDEKYVIPAFVVRSLVESFDLSSDYWKEYLSIFWNNNTDRFEDPYKRD